ncbi:L,D-transpeptidase [Candidatus Legionella polyplacis]|uniref:L,D-transpeptidase n=1 Tax=Candidatus Legionella polyplacis TaxID=2005262 RepID=A0ABZ2GXH1_9GAMM
MIKFFIMFMIVPIIGYKLLLLNKSTLIIDDYGYIHKTLFYLKDKRGQKEFPLRILSNGKKQFVFNPKKYVWAVYNKHGDRIMTGSASGGKDFCKDLGTSCRTVTGSFYIYYKKGVNCRSSEFFVNKSRLGVKMPYCMFFFRGFSIHAAYEVPYANSSHGCIKVLPSAAEWLNKYFMKIGTQVIVLPY